MLRKNIVFLTWLLLVPIISHAQESSVRLFHTEKLNIDTKEVDELWKFVKEITHTGDAIPPPHIHLLSFNSIHGNKLWALWQERWRKRMNTESNPPWIMFDGFHYKGTKIIQINPMLFEKRSTSHELSALLRQEGNLIIGHEMLHYIFSIKGIPSFLEHCIMDIGGFDDAIVTHIYGNASDVPRAVKGICENTPNDLIQGGLLQVYKSPIHNPYFK